LAALQVSKGVSRRTELTSQSNKQAQQIPTSSWHALQLVLDHAAKQLKLMLGKADTYFCCNQSISNQDPTSVLSN
jgi:hypothetical protein